MITFSFQLSRGMSEKEIEQLYIASQKANQCMTDLAKGKLSLSDAVAYCESLDISSEKTIDTLYNDFEYLGFL